MSSCRLELLKRRYVPDVEASHIDENQVEDCTRADIGISPSHKRARTDTAQASGSNIDFGAIAQALKNAQVAQKERDRFGSVNAGISQGEISTYLQAEVSSLRRRKLLPRRRMPEAGFSKARCPLPAVSSDSESEGISEAKETPLDQRKEFSLKDVEMIVQRLLAEQKTRMHYEFETELTKKLQEQSEAFNKYAQDSLKREMQSTQERCFSYLS